MPPRSPARASQASVAARGSASPDAVAAPDAQAAADQVMAVLPRVMDAVRQQVRLQIDSPLTVPQFRCLRFVDRHPGCSISALANFLGVTLATASAMADRLVRAGHLRTQISPRDRRRSELRVEPAGKAELDRLLFRMCNDVASALGGRSPGELAALIEGMRVLDAAFPRMDPP